MKMINRFLDWLFANEEIDDFIQEDLEKELKQARANTEYWRSLCHRILKNTGDVRIKGDLFEFDEVIDGGVSMSQSDGYVVLSAYPKASFYDTEY